MQILATYSSPAGDRELVLVRVPDTTPPLTLLDVAADVRAADDADAQVIDDDLFTPEEARALVADYLEQNGLRRPPVDRASADEEV